MRVSPRSFRQRGFSLVEILVVMLLLSAIALPLLLNSRASSDRLKSQGLARALTEELRAARAHAAQEQTEVVVAFPNGACRSFRVYQGEDVLQPVRTLNFDREYDSYVLSATWPITGTWQTASTLANGRDFPSEMSLIVFRPDGSVTSNLPRAEGAYCLAVGGAMSFGATGGTIAELQAIKDPSTVLVRPSGTIELVDRLYQASPPLPLTEAKPTLVALAPDDRVGEHDPVVNSISFFPRSGSVEGESEGEAGLGKTFIEIHPVGEGERVKEYGLVAVEVEATDVDGGPLFLEVEVTPSSGRSGTLTSEGPVRMEYLQGRWKGTMGWRPPVQADPDTTYSFQVHVSDRDGRVATAKSDASVLPVLSTLADNRLAVEALDGIVYLANLEGGELVRVTPPGIHESQPIWSGDGTKLYVIASEGKEQSFVRYNADGTGRLKVTVFPEDAQAFQVDRSGMYLGFLHSETKQTYRTLSEEGPGDTEVITYSMSILHVSSGKDPLDVASGAIGFSFLPYENGQFQLTVAEVGSEEGPAFDETGIPIEGEVEEYATVGSDSIVSVASGLKPEIKSSGSEVSVSLTNGALSPYEPRYFSGQSKSVYTLAKGRALNDKSLYVFEKRDDYWIDVAELAKNVTLAEQPVWSANGEWIVYLTPGKDGARNVYAQNVQLAEPEAKLKAVVGKPITMVTDQKVESVTPTPGGDAILYIVGQLGTTDSRLMSQRTKAGARPVRIGVNLPGVASYAITQ